MKIFDPNDADTWPLNMQLSEVAQVLRFKDAQVIRGMTEMPEADGGLPCLIVGAGKRRTRLVRRDDLVAFMARTTVGGLNGAVPIKSRTRKAAPMPMITFLDM